MINFIKQFYQETTGDLSLSNQFLLHSSSKETENIAGARVLDHFCWNQLRNLILSTNEFYKIHVRKNEFNTFKGFFEEVEVFGTLEIVS